MEQANHLDQEVDDLTRQIEELKGKLSEARRRRASEPIADYRLLGPGGAPVLLSELFGDNVDLIVVHNMGRGCAYCTMWADGLNGVVDHLADRAAFVVCSPDAPEDQAAFAKERGWRFRMVSAKGSSFAKDLGFEYGPGESMPGFSTFRRTPEGAIVRTGRDFFGPGDDYCPPWRMFDLLAGGAGDWEPRYRYERQALAAD